MTMKKIISIDLGNSMLKAVTITGKGELKKAKLKNLYATDRRMHTTKDRMIEKDGKVVVLGVGKPNNNVLKHTRKYLEQQALTMINELYENDYEVKCELRIGIPANHFLNGAYVDELKNTFVTNQWIEFYMGQDRIKKRVYIEEVKVYAEGYSAFFAIEHILNEMENKPQNVLCCDVGGGTTDLAWFEYNYDDEEYDYVDIHTLEKGVIDLTKLIATEINNDLGSNVKDTRIDALLRQNVDYYEFEGNPHKIDKYMFAIEETVDNMINEITDRFDVLGNYYVVGVGGGYPTFSVIAKNHIKADIEIDKELAFYANAVGYLKQ